MRRKIKPKPRYIVHSISRPATDRLVTWATSETGLTSLTLSG